MSKVKFSEHMLQINDVLGTLKEQTGGTFTLENNPSRLQIISCIQRIIWHCPEEG